jgi:predicted dinucleotide-binding enzyme
MGAASIEVLGQISGSTLAGKILIDIPNPLDFSREMPPSLTVCNKSSLVEQIQKLLPATKVVRTLNTVTTSPMLNPGFTAEDHTIFVAGNDENAKTWADIVLLREWFGWKKVIDLGTIEAARGTEMYLALWVRMTTILKTPNFNVKIVKPSIPHTGRGESNPVTWFEIPV